MYINSRFYADGSKEYTELDDTISVPNGTFRGRVFEKGSLKHIQGSITFTSAIAAYSSVVMQVGIANISEILTSTDGAAVILYGSGWNVLSRQNISAGLTISLNVALPH